MLRLEGNETDSWNCKLCFIAFKLAPLYSTTTLLKHIYVQHGKQATEYITEFMNEMFTRIGVSGIHNTAVAYDDKMICRIHKNEVHSLKIFLFKGYSMLSNTLSPNEHVEV